MKQVRVASAIAALALGASPVFSPAGEAPTASAPSQEELQKKLDEARQRLDASAREVGELSRQLGRQFAFNMMIPGADGPPPRAVLGVSIDTEATQGGAHVKDVSPGSAAAEAGIKSGDVITSIAGLDLSKESDAGRALVEKMRQLEPNLKVQVSVLRDGKKQNFDVAPRPAPMVREFRLQRGGPGDAPVWSEGGAGGRVFNLPVPPGARAFDNMEREIVRRRGDEPGARFRGMEFATLSERLGGYFGVKSGVLVVRTGGNEALKLQDGDVILSIDGRQPNSALHAGRILRSYQPGEKLTLRVQRDRKAQNIEITMPGGRDDD